MTFWEGVQTRKKGYEFPQKKEQHGRKREKGRGSPRNSRSEKEESIRGDPVLPATRYSSCATHYEENSTDRKGGNEEVV